MAQQQAQRYLEHRFGAIGPRRMLSEKKEFDSQDGGFCATHCDQLRLEGVQSLRQVFDSCRINW